MATPEDSFSLTSRPEHNSHTAALDAALFADSTTTATTNTSSYYPSHCDNALNSYNNNNSSSNNSNDNTIHYSNPTGEHQLSWMTTSSSGTLPTTATTTTTTTTTTTSAGGTVGTIGASGTSVRNKISEAGQVFRCTYHDCLREFHRKTSLTNHLKAHKNKNSRSILRSKRMKRNLQRKEEDDRRRRMNSNVDPLNDHLSNAITPPIHPTAPPPRRTNIQSNTCPIDLMPCTSPVSGNGQHLMDSVPSAIAADGAHVGMSSPSSICNTPPHSASQQHQSPQHTQASSARVRSPSILPPPMPSVPAYTPAPPPALPSLLVGNEWATSTSATAPLRVVHSLAEYMPIPRDDGMVPQAVPGFGPIQMPLSFSTQNELGMPSLVDELPPLQTATAISTNSAIDQYDLTPFLLEPSPNNDSASRRSGGGAAGGSSGTVFE